MREVLQQLRERLLRGALALPSTRRQRIVAWHAMIHAGVRDVSVDRDGLTWRIPVGDPHIGFAVFVEGSFALASIHRLLDWLDARGASPSGSDTILDVGANIGTTCIPIVRRCGCRAVAIEPMSETFAMLRENVLRNGYGDAITMVEAAVTSSEDRVRMRVGANIGAAEVARAMNRASDEQAPTVDARGVPLDTILAEVGLAPDAVRLVWADVQGCEGTVIETGARLWATGAPLWAEFEPALLAQQGGIDAFFRASEAHFSHFIEQHQLVREGKDAAPRPISALRDTLASVPLQTDVLLLPAGFPRRA